MESKDNVQPPNYFLSPNMLSITSIHLNGCNYAQWAQAVEVFLRGRKKFDYVINEPPIPTDPKFADWRVEDSQIRSCLWNSKESKISCSLVFLTTAKLLWEQAKELYSGVNNLKWIYDLHQNYFSLSLSELSLEDYHNKFKGVCEELNIYQHISSNVKTMKKQRDSIHVARFLFGLPKILNLVKLQSLASLDLPSLSEVFGRFRQATLFDLNIALFSSSNTDALPSGDKSTFTTYMGSNRGGRGGRGVGVEAVEAVNKGS